MYSDSENEIGPLPYNTPSPYKKKRGRVPGSAKLISFINKEKLTNNLEEIRIIEEKYSRRILENMNKRLFEKTQTINTEKVVDSFILGPLTSGSSKVTYETMKDLVHTVSSTDPYKIYFSSNYYFNKFNHDSLQPSQCISEDSLFGQLTTTEILELIKADALIMSDSSAGEDDLARFLLLLCSVIDNEMIGGKISQLLSQSMISFSDFMTIVNNWGRASPTNEQKSLGKPQSHNFEFVLDRITYSLRQYTRQEAEKLFVFLVNVSLDPLFVNLGHSLLQPLELCIVNLIQKGREVETIIELIDFEDWHVLNIIRVVGLLLNSGKSAQKVGVLLGFRALSKMLIKQEEPTSSAINMDTLFKILQDGKDELLSAKLDISYNSCFLFELLTYRIADRKKFDMWKIINYLEDVRAVCPSEVKSIYFSEVISRIKAMW